MKQRIVIKVQLYGHKQRAKAMGIASAAYGVTSIAITGEAKDQLEVKGDGVDFVELTKSIRKKVSRDASIVRVEEVKTQPQDDPQPSNQQLSIPSAPWIGHQPYPPPFYPYEVSRDASIVRVEEVKTQPQDDPQPPNQQLSIPSAPWIGHPPYPPPFYPYETVYEPSPPTCCIM